MSLYVKTQNGYESLTSDSNTDISEERINYTSMDESNPTSYINLPVIQDNLPLGTLMGTFTVAMSNMRYMYNHKQNEIKRMVISSSAVSSSQSGLLVGSYYAEITMDYSKVPGTILASSIVVLGTDITQPPESSGTSTLARNCILCSIATDSRDSGKITKIGVATDAVRTIRAFVAVLYY